MTRILAKELAPAVRVNAIAPGTITMPGDPPEWQADFIRRAPLRRTGRPDEIADAVSYLIHCRIHDRAHPGSRRRPHAVTLLDAFEFPLNRIRKISSARYALFRARVYSYKLCVSNACARVIGRCAPAEGKANGFMDQETFAPRHVEDVEIQEWLESLDSVLLSSGTDVAREILERLRAHATVSGIDLPFTANTPYANTIPARLEPLFPGDQQLERRIKSLIRWNALAMVVRANRLEHNIGGHISTYASAATLYEVGFNHFFRARSENFEGDTVYFQGHAAPGIYARAFLEGRLSIQQLENFRRELKPGGGLSSYPHPWLMPDFWEYPTVSMGLSPLMAIYQARFNRYLENRGLKPATDAKVWAFLGDGETDEPESLGAITLASREKLDNLIFVVNCNLQRLDGPVRGNGQIIQELESAFRGARWNVIKVLVGHGVGSHPRARHRRPARQAHGRNGRRRIPEARRFFRRLHSPVFLRQRSALAETGRAAARRGAAPPASRRSRSAQSLRRLQSRLRTQRRPHRHSRAHH